LQKHQIACVFHHYTQIATWYDLSDGQATYGNHLKLEALDNELVFNAIIAVSAMHLSKTGQTKFEKLAQRCHQQCVADLIALKPDEHDLLETGLPLTAVTLLRTFEILSGMSLHWEIEKDV
jgi:hypothetical protein